MPTASRRATWTDERLDDLQGEIKRGFERMDERFDRIDDRFDGLYRTLVTVGGGLIAAVIVGFAGIIATQI